MSISSERDALSIRCEAGDTEACEILRRARPMAARGMRTGGLLSDSSRLWKMESEYPEYQKGIANTALYAEGGQVGYNTIPIEEQFQYSPLQQGYQEGGEVGNFMDETGSMLAPEAELNFEDEMMEEEMPMEGEEDILAGLSPEDQEILFQAMSDYPELEEILNTISNNTSSDSDIFDTEGSVEGPGTGTSDSIPAKLSDGEFVFTAKATQQLGVDKLRKMMAKAEEDAEYGDAEQTMAQLGDTGFAAGGLLTKPESYAGGGYTRKTLPISGGIKDLSLGYDGPHFSHGQILKMRKSYGEGFMSRVFPIAKGMFGVKGMREGGTVERGIYKGLEMVDKPRSYLKGKLGSLIYDILFDPHRGWNTNQYERDRLQEREFRNV